MVNPASGAVSFNQLGAQSQNITNPIGFRSTDNFIYGMDPYTFELSRVNNMGQATTIGTANLNNSKIYYAGDITPDGRYLVATGKSSTTYIDDEVVLIDLTSPTFQVTTRSLSLSGPGNISVADIAFHPLTGVLYGYDRFSQRIVTVDHTNGQVDNQSYPTGQLADALGALFFTAFGELYGYGRPTSTAQQDRLYRLDLNSGTLSLIGTGPGATSNDGCSCPYRIEMQKLVSDSVAATCDTISYTVRLINSSGTARSGARFLDSLHAGMNVLAVTRNPFGGTITGIGTNRLEINNMNIPLGLDSLIFDVELTASAPLGTVKTQARLDGLPAALGDLVLSDDPGTLPPGDSTAMTLNPGCLPTIPCDGTFYISAGPNITSARMHAVSYVNNNLTLIPFPQQINHDINAIGYRVTDQLIYGISVATDDAYRIDATGTANFFVNLSNRIDPALEYFAGDVSPTGQYWYLMGSVPTAINPGQPQQKLYKIDLTDPTYPATLVNLTTLSGALPTSYCADIAVSPINGLIYGFDRNAGKLVTIDPNSGVVDGSQYPSLGANAPRIVGALFFDTFGELYGYGSRPNSNPQLHFMHLDIQTGQISFLATGTALDRNDGCSCPYTIQMQQEIDSLQVAACDTFELTIRIANNSGIARTGLDLEESFPAGFQVLNVLQNPFGGAVNALPAQHLNIQNMTVPLGLDSIVLQVLVNQGTASGSYNLQAQLTGLPTSLGDTTLSDWPRSNPRPDPTVVQVTPFTPSDLPNDIIDLCAGDSISLDRTLPGGVSYQWMDNFQGAVRTISQAGQYSLMIDDGCTVFLDTIDVIARPKPQLRLSPDTMVCTGDTIQLRVSGATIYTWGFSPFLQGNLSSTPIVFPTSSFTAYVTGINQFGCSTRDSIDIQVLALPQTYAGPDTVICPGDLFTLGSIAITGHQYRWNTSLHLNDSTVAQPVFSTATPGQHVYTLEQTSAEGCVNRDAVLVDVNDIQASVQTIGNQCYDDSSGQAFATVSGGGSPFQYTWYDAGGNVIASTSRPEPNDSIGGLTTGSYSVTVENRHGCIADTNFVIQGSSSPLLLSLDSVVNVDCFWKPDR